MFAGGANMCFVNIFHAGDHKKFKSSFIVDIFYLDYQIEEAKFPVFYS